MFSDSPKLKMIALFVGNQNRSNHGGCRRNAIYREPMHSNLTSNSLRADSIPSPKWTADEIGLAAPMDKGSVEGVVPKGATAERHWRRRLKTMS